MLLNYNNISIKIVKTKMSIDKITSEKKIDASVQYFKSKEHNSFITI